MITSAEEFVRLRLSESAEDYGRAGSEDAPASVWLDVVARFPEMREWVAHNKTVPLDILESLARDEDARVRAGVAAKRKLSVALFERLSRDNDEAVRHQLACNAKAPEHVMQHLSVDPVELVRNAALKRLRKS